MEKQGHDFEVDPEVQYVLQLKLLSKKVNKLHRKALDRIDKKAKTTTFQDTDSKKDKKATKKEQEEKEKMDRDEVARCKKEEKVLVSDYEEAK